MNENIKTNVWKAGLAVGILLAVFLLVISIKELKSLPSAGHDVPIMNTISVNGKGEKAVIPNVATFSFSVTETAKTVTEAQTKATTKTNAALAALDKAGIEKKDITTTSYNINPHYEYQNYNCTTSGYCPSGKQVLTGYDVSQTIEVKVRSLDKAGEIFATIGSLDVQNVNGLNFSIDDIDSVKNDAQKIAIDNAQAKADALAKQLGVKLVRITSFYDNSGDGPIYYAKTMNADAASAPRAQMAVAPQVPTGEQKVTSNVTITYEIR